MEAQITSAKGQHADHYMSTVAGKIVGTFSPDL